jgi:RNA polymerase sigma-70 factor (ECF subfamily)
MADPTTELFEKAVRLHSRRLLAIARGIVGSQAAAEDVLQQAILNLYEHRARYDWTEPIGLLRRTVVNEALRTLRSPRMSLVADDHPGRSITPVGGIIDQETVQIVQRAIAELPEHFRAALVLCEYENMSYVEIARILEASVPQVKTWLHRGRRQLGEKLKEFMEAKPKGDRLKEKRLARQQLNETEETNPTEEPT